MRSVAAKTLYFAIACAAVFSVWYKYQDQLPQVAQTIQDVGQQVRARLSTPGPCDQPITYSIGSFDGRFGIDKQQLLEVTDKAAAIWNGVLGKDILHDSVQGSVKINLVYDYRQQTTDKLKEIGIKIDDTQSSYDSLKANYNTMISAYGRQKSSFDAEVSKFESAKSTYEKEVSHWNSVGGAPAAQYAVLQREKAGLDAQSISLEDEQSKLNDSVNAINSAASLLNGMAHDLNMNVKTFNSVSTSTGKVFNEGQYIEYNNGKNIYIYEFEDQDKLLRVIAHELGHAIGLEHVQDSNAIMYYLNEGSNETPTAADIQELEKVCGAK